MVSNILQHLVKYSVLNVHPFIYIIYILHASKVLCALRDKHLGSTDCVILAIHWWHVCGALHLNELCLFFLFYSS
jgi:hypothetical protein